MQPTLQLDTQAFNRVMQEYQRVNRRSWPEIVNKEALDVSFGALAQTPKASGEQIKALPKSKDWWPKYVAKRIKAGVSFTIMTNNPFHGRQKMKKRFAGAFTRKQAIEVSRRIIGARARSIAFVKSGWLPAIRRLWPLVKDKAYVKKTTNTARQYGVDKGSARPAVPGDNPTAWIENSAIGVDKVGIAPLQRAVDAEVQDMRVYIARKLGEDARRVAR